MYILVTYRCGHSARVRTFSKNPDLAKKYLEMALCPECERAAKKSAAAIKKYQNDFLARRCLPLLSGSPSEIRRANQTRPAQIRALDAYRAGLCIPADLDKIKALDALIQVQNARFWISRAKWTFKNFFESHFSI